MSGTGRACIGLGLAGQGAAILSGIVPHEDLVVGAGLLGFGAVLVATGALPRLEVRRGSLLAAGGLMLGLVGLAWAATGHAPRGPMMLLAALACSTILAGAFHGWAPAIRGRRLAVRDLAPCAAIALGVPILVWMAQATFKRYLGATPLEAFEVAFLVTPVHWVLAWLGVASTMEGQNLTLAGSRGLLAVEVGVACSGLQAMALFLGILGLFAVTVRPSGRRLAWWALVGLAGVYVSNVLRLVAVILAGHTWGADALQGVHAHAGWAFFVAWSLLFAAWVRRGLPPTTMSPTS